MNKALINTITQMIALREIEELRAFIIHELESMQGIDNIQFIHESKARSSIKPTDNQNYEYQYHRIIQDGSIEEEPFKNFTDKHQLPSKTGLTLIDSTSFSFLIKVNNNLVIYLFFNADNFSDDSRFLIETLINVFQNQMDLLLAGEIDELTELHNRKAFERACSNLFANASELDDSLSLTCFAMLDIDYFKSVNDEYGHLYGDEVLLLFAQLMKKSFRTSDQLFRYGGEEFSVIMSDCNPTQARKVLERFRVLAEAHHYPQVGNKTVSIGYTLLLSKNGAPLTIDQADQALYFSKDNGRNQVTYYDDLEELKKFKPKESTETVYF